MRASLALVVTVRRAAFPGEAVVGAGPPEYMHLGRLCVTAAGGTVTEAGKGWPDFHTLCCDRALDSLPELDREFRIQSSVLRLLLSSSLRGGGHKPACLFWEWKQL